MAKLIAEESVNRVMNLLPREHIYKHMLNIYLQNRTYHQPTTNEFMSRRTSNILATHEQRPHK